MPAAFENDPSPEARGAWHAWQSGDADRAWLVPDLRVSRVQFRIFAQKNL
jgi:hypothetical protein